MTPCNNIPEPSRDNPSYQNKVADPDPRLTPELALAFYHVVHCAATDKPCAALLDELHRLYTAAGEPFPAILGHYDPVQVTMEAGHE